MSTRRTILAGGLMTVLALACTPDGKKKSRTSRKRSPSAGPASSAASASAKPTSATPRRPPVLRNAGFEKGVERWQTFGASVGAESGVTHGGQKSLKLFRDFGNDEPHAVGVYQELDVHAGKTYLFAAHVRDGDGSSDHLDGAGTVALEARWFDADGAEIADPVANAGHRYRGGLVQDDAWHLQAVYLTVPEDAVKGRLNIAYAYDGADGGAGKGSAWVDDVIFRPAPRDLLANGGFEAGLDHWTSFGDNAEAQSQGALAGDKSLKLYRSFGEEGETHVNGVAQEVPVSAGGSYVLTALARSGVGAEDRLEDGSKGRIRVEWLTSASEPISAVEIDGLEPRYAGRVVERLGAPPRAARAKIAVLVHYLGKGGGGGSVWFDDLRLASLD